MYDYGARFYMPDIQWEADQNARRSVYTNTLRSSNMLPRFMTVHE